MSDKVKVKLKKPVTAHGEEVSELELREPTAGDVMEIGVPQLLIPSADGETVGVEIRASVVGRYISRLAAIPLSSVKALSVTDYSACSQAVMGFFSESAA